MGSAAAAGEPYRGDDRRGAPDGLVRRCLGRQQPQRLQARGEGDARRLAGQKGMIKTGRRGGADDNAAISTCCGHRNQREEPSGYGVSSRQLSYRYQVRGLEMPYGDASSIHRPSKTDVVDWHVAAIRDEKLCRQGLTWIKVYARLYRYLGPEQKEKTS